MPAPGPLVWNLWVTTPDHGETCVAHGSLERCQAEQAYLEQMAEKFDGRDPYPRRDYSIEEA